MAGQMIETTSPRRPGLLLRWFYRAPALLYRVGLGGLMFGQLRLTSVGRKSGRPRHAVVDVLKHDAATDTYCIVSVYGGRSDWYRNLQANPTARVQVGRRRFLARATALPDAEAEALIVDFWRRHRLYAGTMLRLIGIKAGTEDDMRAAAANMNVLALQPVEDD